MAVTEPWERVVQTTLPRFFKGSEDAIMRNRKLLAWLKRDGRVKMNMSGRYMDWEVEYKRGDVSTFFDSSVLSFSRKQRWKNARLEYRGFSSTDSVTKTEIAQNKGNEQRIDLFDRRATRLRSDLENKMGDELYIDGYANSGHLMGIESMMGASGDVVNSPLAAPSDTYAELTTGLGDYLGIWDSTAAGAAWPLGTGQEHHDFFSPMLLDITNTLAAASGGWQSGTATWAARCVEIIRYGITHSNRNKGVDGQVNQVMLNLEFHRLLKEALDDKEHIYITQGKDNADGTTGVGFTNTVAVDGVPCDSEYGVPANVGYGFNTRFMELHSLWDVLFRIEGPNYEQRTDAYEFAGIFTGNLKFVSPRNFFKMANYGGNGV